MNSWHDHFKKICNDSGFKQIDIAKSAGVSSGYISDLINGKKKAEPTRPVLIGLAKKFDISLDYLCTGKYYDQSLLTSRITEILDHVIQEYIGKIRFTIAKLK